MGKGKKKKKNLLSKFKSSSDATPRSVVQSRNWAELPSDIMSSIFSRLGTIGILTSAQMVCLPWYNICKEPLTWSTINMKNDGLYDRVHYKLEKMCRYAVDLSCGNLVDIDIEYFATDDLLRYITQRSSRIKCLRLAHCGNISDEGLSKVVSKLTLLEDIDISLCKRLSSESLKVLGNSCPLLKSLKFNKKLFNFLDEEIDYCFRTRESSNGEACAISATMPGLLHLQLLGNNLDQEGFKMIIKGCAHLESLDLRLCPRLQYLKHDLGGRTYVECMQNLQLPGDSDYDDNNSQYIYQARFRSGDYYDGYYDYSFHNYKDHEHILEHYRDLADFCL